MRVTSETKEATRKRILQAAQHLFSQQGFQATTTRDIALLAKIGSGTLFNYFPTKEAIVACLANEALGESGQQAAGDWDGESLEEDLFALVAASLRKLKPLRKYLPSLLETSLSPLVAVPNEASSLRATHLEAVTAVAAKHGHKELSAVALQLYWTLYTGVLVFWANDRSPKQEDTLALIDQSATMFASWLRDHASPDSTARKR